MNFPRYPEYKDSGVAWLGKVPAHWRVERFKQIFKEREERSISGEETLLSVSAYTGVSPRSEIVSEGDHLSRAESLEGYKVCYPDDLVMNIMLAWNRGLAFSQHHGIVSPAYSVFQAIDDRFDVRFMNYLMRDDRYTLYYKAFSSGVIDSRLRLYPDTFGSLSCAHPDREEQKLIADFLDSETAKIDALVAEQEKLMALLKEKRQAVVSHSVTKGLDSTVPMKDSGVEWLGEVPAHWDTNKTSRLFSAKKGSDAAQLTKEYCSTIDGEYPVYSGQTENSGVMSSIDRFEFDSGENGYLFSTTVGAKAMSVMHLKGRFSLSQNCMVIIPAADELAARFFFYHFQILFLFERKMIPDHMQPSFRMEDLYQYRVAVPPLAEQLEIFAFLDRTVAAFDALHMESESSISLLQERRSALISAAVTGKIDVRDLIKAKAA